MIYSIYELLLCRKINYNTINDITYFNSKYNIDCYKNKITVIKKYKGTIVINRKGYKYIMCYDSEYNDIYKTTRVWCHELQIELFNVNDCVLFILVIIKNKPYAKDIHLIKSDQNIFDKEPINIPNLIIAEKPKITLDNPLNIIDTSKVSINSSTYPPGLKPIADTSLVLECKRYTGIIQNYYENKQYGLIKINDIDYLSIFGKSICYINKYQWDQCKCNIGELISFNVKIIKKNPVSYNINRESKRYKGFIKCFLENDTFGYITCTDPDYLKKFNNCGKDPCFDKQVLDKYQDDIDVGDLVSFILYIYGTLPKAHMIKLESKRYTGIVNSYCHDNGIGTITSYNENYLKIYGNTEIILYKNERERCECAKIFTIKDPFGHKHKANICKCNVGDLVSFIIEENKEFLQATYVCHENQRYMGIIESYDDNKRFGFISCYDKNYIKTYGNALTFLHKDDLDRSKISKTYTSKDTFISKFSNQTYKCNKGDLISFIISSKDKRQIQARNIYLENKRYIGTVTSYCVDKGIGLISCNATNYINIYGNKDVILHKMQRDNCHEGIIYSNKYYRSRYKSDIYKCHVNDLVSFFIDIINGEPQAISICLEGKLYVGSVKENNFGIIYYNNKTYRKLYNTLQDNIYKNESQLATLNFTLSASAPEFVPLSKELELPLFIDVCTIPQHYRLNYEDDQLAYIPLISEFYLSTPELEFKQSVTKVQFSASAPEFIPSVYNKYI